MPLTARGPPQAGAPRTSMRRSRAISRRRAAPSRSKASGGTSRTRTTRKADASPLEQVLNSKTTQTILNSVIRGMFGTGRR